MHPLKDMGRYGTVGIELIVSMGLGYYGGRWLDGRVNGHGWVTGIGAALGIFMGFYGIWKASQTMERDIAREERRRDSTSPASPGRGLGQEEKDAKR